MFSISIFNSFAEQSSYLVLDFGQCLVSYQLIAAKQYYYYYYFIVFHFQQDNSVLMLFPTHI